MNISKPFIHRPVATTLLTVAVALAGAIAFRCFPYRRCRRSISPRSRSAATLPGASPETMASAVATPLERQFGRIAGVTEMTSSSYLGQLPASRCNSISTATSTPPRAMCRPPSTPPAATCRRTCRRIPRYRKVNPADSPIFMIALTSDVLDRGQMYDAASSIMAQKLSQIKGVGPGAS